MPRRCGAGADRHRQSMRSGRPRRNCRPTRGHWPTGPRTMSALIVTAQEKSPRIVQTDRVPYSLVLRNGQVYDGGGGLPFVADVAVEGERVVVVGSVPPTPG